MIPKSFQKFLSVVFFVFFFLVAWRCTAQTSSGAVMTQQPDHVFFDPLPADIAAGAMRAERLVTERLVWTPALRALQVRFVQMTVSGLPNNEDGADALDEGKLKTIGLVETNCYLIASLLHHPNENVRRAVVKYFSRARGFCRSLAAQDPSHLLDEIYKGTYDPSWCNDVVLPLWARSMFDKSKMVRDNISYYTFTFGKNDKNKIVSWAHTQGTNACAKEMWFFLHQLGATNLIPSLFVPDIQAELHRIAVDRWFPAYLIAETNRIPSALYQDVKNAFELDMSSKGIPPELYETWRLYIRAKTHGEIVPPELNAKMEKFFSERNARMNVGTTSEVRVVSPGAAGDSNGQPGHVD